LSPQAPLDRPWVKTQLDSHGIGDEIYRRVRAQFSEKELSDLTFAIATINFWNRLNVPFQTPPGSADALLGLTKAGLT